MPERKSEKKPVEKKMKLQWKRYKTATIGTIIVAIVGTLFVVIGIFSLKGSPDIGYVFLIFGILLYCAVGYDIYRMYGY
jgi:uncharacterized membrane protein